MLEVLGMGWREVNLEFESEREFPKNGLLSF